MKPTSMLLLTSLTLAACGAPHDSLQQFVATAGTNLPRGNVPALPITPQHEPANYGASELRDPFAAPRKAESARPAPQHRDPLEAYSLETLRMIGTVQHQGAMHALVRAPDGMIHRVRAGQRMGQNFGYVTGVTEAAITLTELTSDTDERQTRNLVVQLVSE